MRCPVRSEDCDVSAKDLFTFAFFYTLFVSSVKVWICLRVMPLTPIHQKKWILLVEVVSQMNAKQTWWLLIQPGNTFTFHAQIATSVQKDFPPCRRCFAELVLVGNE